MTSPFDGLVYGWRAFDYTRFVVDPIDDRVASIVDDWRAAGRDAAALTDRDSYLLLGWSQRYALRALRDGSLDAAVLSLRGAALMRQSTMDFRDFSADYSLYAVNALGGELSGLLNEISASADADAISRLTARAASARRWTLRDLGLTEVRSRYGLGFLPSLGGKSPSPTLASVAIALADALDDEGTNEIRGLHSSDLWDVWFTREQSNRKMPVVGCVSLSTAVGENGLIGFVVETRSDVEAADLVEVASNSGRGGPSVAVASDRRFVLLVRAVPPSKLDRLDYVRELVDRVLGQASGGAGAHSVAGSLNEPAQPPGRGWRWRRRTTPR